ncbi:MAG: hypothetical protein LBQ54_14665 [Planctomycetaceae bacterium]|nr:hypothetical protein [Planctomycetaceae bacterium]
MPPAGNARALHPGWDYRPESHELAPDGRWYPLAEQRFQPQVDEKMLHWKRTERSECEPTARRGVAARRRQNPPVNSRFPP